MSGQSDAGGAGAEAGDASGNGGPAALLGWVGRGYEGGSPFRKDPAEKVRELLARRLLTTPSNAAFGLSILLVGLAAICWGDLPLSHLSGWLGAIVLSTVLRHWLPRTLAEHRRDRDAIVRGTRWGLIASAVAWGWGFAAVAPELELARLLLVILFFGSVGATTAVTLSGDLPSFNRFGAVLFAGVVVGVLRHGQTDIHWLAIGAMAVYSIFTVFLLRRNHQGLRSELKARVELERHDQRMEGERAFLTALLQSLPDAIVAMHEDGRVLGVNRGFEETFGWKPLEILGRDLFDLVVPEDQREEARGEVREIVEEGAGVRDVERIRKDGSRVPVRILAAPIQEHDVIVVLYSDITRLKETEAELERAKEMAEQANRAKSEFLATMSHEIRTPMNAIIGMAELLAETELTAAQRDYVEVFRTAGDTLLSLINQILDLSKIEAGRLELDERDFDLWDLVDRTIQVFAVPAHQKGVELAARVEPDVERWVVGDPDRIRQILVNLLGNAVKFTEDGEVVVHVHRADDGATASDGRMPVRFEVRDTGPGIPEDRQQAIFERFTQADSSTTRQHGGTGLGLTISTALAELMDGSMGLESEPGTGSTFHFTVPLRSGRPQEPEEDDRGTGEITGLRVLIVDDNATNRLVLREMLMAWGADPRAVGRGWDALDELAASRDGGRPYDLVLLDGQMPGLDGFEVAQRIQENPGLAGPTLMMLTSSGDQPQDLEKARSAGIEHYLVKPVRRAELLETIRHALGAGAEAEEAVEEEADEAEERSYRVLLVEDTEENRILVEAYIAKTPHEIRSVERGEAAIEAYTADPEAVDLIFMDIRMPGMDGYEATRTIREWEREREMDPVPIVALTAHALEEERQKSMDAGCDAHLTKPVKKKKLLETVADYARLRPGSGGSASGAGTAAEDGAPPE